MPRICSLHQNTETRFSDNIIRLVLSQSQDLTKTRARLPNTKNRFLETGTYSLLKRKKKTTTAQCNKFPKRTVALLHTRACHTSASTVKVSGHYARLCLETQSCQWEGLRCYLLPVLLQRRERGEVSGVVHYLELLEDAAHGDDIHFEKQKSVRVVKRSAVSVRM